MPQSCTSRISARPTTCSKNSSVVCVSLSACITGTEKPGSILDIVLPRRTKLISQLESELEPDISEIARPLPVLVRLTPNLKVSEFMLETELPLLFDSLSKTCTLSLFYSLVTKVNFLETEKPGVLSCGAAKFAVISLSMTDSASKSLPSLLCRPGAFSSLKSCVADLLLNLLNALLPNSKGSCSFTLWPTSVRRCEAAGSSLILLCSLLLELSR